MPPTIMSIDTFIDLKEIASADQLFKLLDSKEKENRWIFRGQRNEKWGLKTSMDRMFEEFQDDNLSKINLEIALVKRFQRESHHYGVTNNDYLNIPEWLALMQHYGAPTRLHDWTHSPWVALFFATIDLKKTSAGALWLADWQMIDSRTDKNLLELYKTDFNVIAIDDFITTVQSGDGVIKLNSFKQNQRQIVQQGTFLFPTNIEKSFEENWITKLSFGGLLKFIIPYRLKAEIIKKLYRMNISFTTLFPGIEGFSKSLGYLHFIDGILKLEDNIRGYDGYKKKFRK